MQAAIAYAYEKPTQRNRSGEIPEACRGHQDMACMERSVEELGRPYGFLHSQNRRARGRRGTEGETRTQREGLAPKRGSDER